jgi:hypothetical protein
MCGTVRPHRGGDVVTLIISRSGWGALSPNRSSGPRATTTHVFVHHSATVNPTSTRNPADIEESKQQTRAIQADHLGRTFTLADGTTLLWADIAYNMLVGPGCLLEGRGWNVRGGGTGIGTKVPHPTGSWDNVSVSICVLGNYQEELLDPATRASLIDAFREARRRFGDGGLQLLVDRDVNSTACCGDSLVPAVAALWDMSASPSSRARRILRIPRRSSTPAVCLEENNVIHQPRLRAGTMNTWDITYMPRDGQRFGSSVVQSHVVIRGTAGRSQRVEVFFDGVKHLSEIPADGRSVAIAVEGAGLVSVVGNSLVVEGREIWATA